MSAFAEVKAPRSGAVYYDAVTTSASSAQEIGIDQIGYTTFLSDVDLWILFGNSDVAAPDETETVDGELDIPFRLLANTPTHFRIDRGTRYFRQKGSAAGELRFYKSGS